MLLNTVPPAFIYIIAALVLGIFRIKRFRQSLILALPVLAFFQLLYLSPGVYWNYDFLGYTITFGKVDKLSLVFSYIFVIASFIGSLYSLHLKKAGQHCAAYVYMGSTLGLVLAGDLISLFVFWELMAISSTFLICHQKTDASFKAAFRYVLYHIAGSGFLLAGIILHISSVGSIEVALFDLSHLSGKLILIGFLVNAAVPPLHTWLSDAYPEATVSGSVFLSAFTTKSAVYILCRCFPGAEPLVWLGAVMALYGVVYAVLENDIRRLLGYHIISQVGYMVCGVGLGSEMAINGASAHGFCHILYKSVLFMGVGAVIHVTGRNKMTELQGRGLYKKMPITLGLYMIGALSISGFPLFNGFVSKTMVVAAAGELHRPTIEIMLHLASVGTFLHTGLKLPWGVWFGPQKTEEKEIKEAKEPPWNMLLAMGIAAFLCVLIGVWPQLLYNHLPYQVTFQPYKAYYVVSMGQLLLFTFLAFVILIKKLGGEPGISLDADWFIRRPLRNVWERLWSFLGNLMEILYEAGVRLFKGGVFFINYLPKLSGELLSGKWADSDYQLYQCKNVDVPRVPVGVSVCVSVIVVAFSLLLIL